MDQCQCSVEQVRRYMSKISGPLLDRIDMQVEVAKLAPELLNGHEQHAESSEIVKMRVLAARDQQLKRQNKYNHALTVPELDQWGQMENTAQRLLNQIMTKFNLSARVYHRIVKVARTIADLEGGSAIEQKHLSEALNYRCLDRMKAAI